MKRTITVLCVAAAACWVLAAGIHAQSTTGSMGSQSGTQSSYGQSSMSKTGEMVKLTGCLQTDPSGKGYILTNVTEGGENASSSSDTEAQSGVSGAQGTSGMENNVELVAAKNVELKDHVGHRVEVTGTTAGKAKNLKGSMGSGGTGSETGTSGSSGSMTSSTTGSNSWAGQRIKVDSIRHIADSCSGQ